MKRTKMVRISWIVGVLFLASLCIGLNANAEAETKAISGSRFEFDGKTDYPISESNPVDSDDRYGSLTLSADIVSESIDQNGIQKIVVKNNQLQFYYNNTDLYAGAGENEWHLTNDKCSVVDGKKIGNSIGKGLLLLQTSKDRINWTNVYVETNAFSNKPVRTGLLYEATDIQLMNGCYYRLIVAHELSIKEGTSGWWIFKSDKYDYKRIADVYEIYAQDETAEVQEFDPEHVYYIGEMVHSAEYDSYKGKKEITKSDPHYGWELGRFFLSGYTSLTRDSAGKEVILKNVGDRVTLWFKLNQDINKLNGSNSMKINTDDDWYDGYFQTERTKGGKGVLIIQHTNYKNEKGKPVIYTNYLESNVTVGADTKIQVFEEGDYDIALDYEIIKDKKTYHYRISASFLVRNGNCMIYPLDCVTGGELVNGSLTTNGFTLDYAKSRYLNCTIKKEILADNGLALKEDTRFNKVVKDGDVFTEEGIYTITIRNNYTGVEPTEKKIYVGSNPVLKAYIARGCRNTIEEITEFINLGAVINDDGSILFPAFTNPPEPTIPPSSNYPHSGENTQEPRSSETVTRKKANWIIPVIVVLVSIIIVISLVILLNKKKKVNMKGTEEK